MASKISEADTNCVTVVRTELLNSASEVALKMGVEIISTTRHDDVFSVILMEGPPALILRFTRTIGELNVEYVEKRKSHAIGCVKG